MASSGQLLLGGLGVPHDPEPLCEGLVLDGLAVADAELLLRSVGMDVRGRELLDPRVLVDGFAPVAVLASVHAFKAGGQLVGKPHVLASSGLPGWRVLLEAGMGFGPVALD